MGNQNSLKMNQNIFNNILNNSLKLKDSFQFKSIIVKTNLLVFIFLNEVGFLNFDA